MGACDLLKFDSTNWAWTNAIVFNSLNQVYEFSDGVYNGIHLPSMRFVFCQWYLSSTKTPNPRWKKSLRWLEPFPRRIMFHVSIILGSMHDEGSSIIKIFFSLLHKKILITIICSAKNLKAKQWRQRCSYKYYVHFILLCLNTLPSLCPWPFGQSGDGQGFRGWKKDNVIRYTACKCTKIAFRAQELFCEELRKK